MVEPTLGKRVRTRSSIKEETKEPPKKRKKRGKDDAISMIVLGPAGVGKSTVLIHLVGKKKFKAGKDFVGGVTREL